MFSNSFCSHCGRGTPITTNRVLPVNELLISNEPPSPFQHGLACIFIKDVHKDIQTIDEEIAKAQAVVDGLLATREALRRQHRSHQAIFSPMHRLLHELLSEIFILCLPPFPTRISCFDAPLVLEQICWRWKSIARSTPRLWSSICLDLR